MYKRGMLCEHPPLLCYLLSSIFNAITIHAAPNEMRLTAVKTVLEKSFKNGLHIKIPPEIIVTAPTIVDIRFSGAFFFAIISCFPFLAFFGTCVCFTSFFGSLRPIETKYMPHKTTHAPTKYATIMSNNKFRISLIKIITPNKIEATAYTFFDLHLAFCLHVAGQNYLFQRSKNFKEENRKRYMLLLQSCLVL